MSESEKREDEMEKRIEKEKTTTAIVVPYVQKGSKITFTNKQAFLEAFDEFKAQRLQEILLSSGIQGNRAGLNARVELMTEFLHSGKTKADFVRLCALRGYSQEKREELWNDFEQVWIPEFKKSLMQTEKKEETEEFTI